MSSTSNLSTLKVFTIKEVLTHYHQWNVKEDGKDKVFTIDDKDWLVKMTSLRYAVFSRSTKCITCGLEADHFRLQASKGSELPRAHWNLYATVVDDEGNEELRLFTKDHIIPKSRRGPDHIENFQTMCEKCNGRKGNNIPDDAPHVARYSGYGWIQVKQWKEKPAAPLADNYESLKKHHEKETTFLIEEIRKLAAKLDFKEKLND